MIAKNYVRLDLGPPPRWGHLHFVIAFCDGDNQHKTRCNFYLRINDGIEPEDARSKKPFPSVSAFRYLQSIKPHCVSNGKTTFQSFFISITVHLFTAAASNATSRRPKWDFLS